MSVEGFYMGHEIMHKYGDWFYKDDGCPVSEDPNRKCSKCSKENRKDDCDPCIGKLQGPIKNACCGHGRIDEAYIHFIDDTVVRGEGAIKIMNVLKEKND